MAVLRANPDFVSLVCSPHFNDWSQSFLESCTVAYPASDALRSCAPCPSPMKKGGAGELSIDAIQELDYGPLINEAMLPGMLHYSDDWDVGVRAVSTRQFLKALLVFMHTSPPGGLCKNTLQSTRVAIGLMLLACHEVGVPEEEVPCLLPPRAVHVSQSAL